MTLDEKTILKQAYNNYAEHRDKSELPEWKFAERERFLHRIKSGNARPNTRGLAETEAFEAGQSVASESALPVKLLEIGAGPGRDSLYFQQQGIAATCIDLSEEMVRLCREKGLNAYVMDFGELDFPDEAFEAVYAMNCLLHVPKAKLEGVLTEIRRVLKPGGLFFCGLYGGGDSEGIWERDFYEPKRFFSMFGDEAVQKVYGSCFLLEDFHTVDMGGNTPHFQSLLLRKP